MKRQRVCSIVIMALGFLSLAAFTQSSHKLNENLSYDSIDFPQKLRSEELKIEAKKKAGLTKIKTGYDQTLQ